jgi:Protein of unknown function (DUF1360)
MTSGSLSGSDQVETKRSAAERPLNSYGLLVATFLGSTTAFAAWLVRSDRPVPDRVELGDVVLMSIATHKASRLLTKDRVTSVLRAPFTRHQEDTTAGEVEEAARGSGLRRAIGELIICPYCIGLWIASALTAGLLVAPRLTRWIAFALSTLTVSDFLQIAYRKAEDTL